MQQSAVSPDEILQTAMQAARYRAQENFEILDDLAAAVYMTNAEGRLTYFNRACVDFSGRTPSLGKDSWCVSWKLYTDDGEYLPHDQCPMAVAIRGKHPVRGISAIAERPDGSRVNFVPYPTPVLDEHGELIGAVNILIDMTEISARAEHYRAQAQRCRRLANSMGDKQTASTLTLMASEYEEKVRELQRDN